MAAARPHEPPLHPSNEPPVHTPDDQNPTPAHLTPSHAFPPTADSERVDPAHARASPSKNDGTDSEEHHHRAEQGYDSCASCRAAGKTPFQGHAEREEGCTCVMGEGAVPTGIHEGNAGKGGSQHDDTSFSLASLPRGANGAVRYGSGRSGSVGGGDIWTKG